jgi:hypothetical protein
MVKKTIPNLKIPIASKNSSRCDKTVLPLSALCIPAHIRQYYKNLIIVSHSRHIPLLDVSDSNSLIVATDWLVWQEIVDLGGHCLHIEAMLGDYDNDTDFFLHCADWVYINKTDVTEFEGMSIGKSFNREIELALLSFKRSWCAINKFCCNFKIETIILYDLRGDYGLIDNFTKSLIVESIAQENNLTTEIILDTPADNDPSFYDATHYGIAKKENKFKSLLRELYALIVDLAFEMKWFVTGRRHRVFLLLNYMMTKSLIVHTPPAGPAPLLIAEQLPKSFSFLASTWFKGGYLGRFKEVPLDNNGQDSVSKIISKISRHWDTNKPQTPFEIARRHYIQSRILKSGRIYKVAQLATAYKKFFSRKKVASIIVGDSTNQQCRLAVEAANSLGIQSNEILNGMFSYDLKYDVRCGDGEQLPKLSRFLAWGRQQESWLRAIGSSLPCIRTGYPGLDLIGRTNVSLKLPPVGQGNVLVVPCYITVDNVRGMKSNMFMLLVEIIHMLNDLGYKNVRMKIHPGGSGTPFFERLIQKFNLGCELVRDGTVPEHLEWADFVVGPADSGSMVETLAYGKPYFGFATPPTSLNKSFYGPYKIFESVDELQYALINNELPNRHMTLNQLCNSPDFQPASPNVWQALSKTLPT